MGSLLKTCRHCNFFAANFDFFVVAGTTWLGGDVLLVPPLDPPLLTTPLPSLGQIFTSGNSSVSDLSVRISRLKQARGPLDFRDAGLRATMNKVSSSPELPVNSVPPSPRTPLPLSQL